MKQYYTVTLEWNGGVEIGRKDLPRPIHIWTAIEDRLRGRTAVASHTLRVVRVARLKKMANGQWKETESTTER